jgi:hypothetical protein
MTATRSGIALLLLCAGMMIWGSAFLSLYAVLSLGCAFGWEDLSLGPLSLQRAVLVGLWLAHLAALLLLLRWTRRQARQAAAEDRQGSFLARAAFHATAVALAATVINYAPVLTLSACL